MSKFRVMKNRQITYPDGSLRGMAGYVVDGDAASERETLATQGDALEPVERQSPVSPVDPARMLGGKTTTKKAAKKKTAKKKASKKAT